MPFQCDIDLGTTLFLQLGLILRLILSPLVISTRGEEGSLTAKKKRCHCVGHGPWGENLDTKTQENDLFCMRLPLLHPTGREISFIV